MPTKARRSLCRIWGDICTLNTPELSRPRAVESQAGGASTDHRIRFAARADRNPRGHSLNSWRQQHVANRDTKMILVPSDMHAEIKNFAQRDDRTIQSAVRKLVRIGLAEVKKSPESAG